MTLQELCSVSYDVMSRKCIMQSEMHLRWYICSRATDNVVGALTDEPTSHLDLLSIDALTSCLQAFKGAVVIVSHDQHFVSSIAKQVRHDTAHW